MYLNMDQLIVRNYSLLGTQLYIYVPNPQEASDWKPWMPKSNFRSVWKIWRKCVESSLIRWSIWTYLMRLVSLSATFSVNASKAGLVLQFKHINQPWFGSLGPKFRGTCSNAVVLGMWGFEKIEFRQQGGPFMIWYWIHYI